MEKAIAAMTAGGAIIIDSVKIESTSKFGRAGFDVLLYEFKEALNVYLSNLNPEFPIKTLENIIRFNEDNRDEAMPYFEQEIMILAQVKGDLTEKEYLDALEKCLRLSREESIDKALSEYNLDAIVAPTGGPAWVTDRVNGDHFGGGSSSLSARAGYPDITVPPGNVNGLPVGLSFFSTAYREPELIAMAYAFEQKTRARIIPEMKQTIIE